MLSTTPKLLSGIEDSHHGPSDAMHNPPQPLKKDSILQVGNHVKEILLNWNLPNHRSILTDSKIHIKMEWRYLVPAAVQDKSRFIATCSYSTDKCKDIMKAQYEHVDPKVTRTQDGKRSQDDDMRLYLADDLKMTQDHKQVKTKEQALS
ncbi:hypothetical protein Tco_0662870 [Tanacetum coccineum]